MNCLFLKRTSTCNSRDRFLSFWIHVVFGDVSLNAVKFEKIVYLSASSTRRDPTHSLAAHKPIFTNWWPVIIKVSFFYGTGISARLVQKGICLEGTSNKGVFHRMLLHVYPISFQCLLVFPVALPCCLLGNGNRMFLPNFLYSFCLSVIPLLCLFGHCLSIKCVVVLLFLCVCYRVKKPCYQLWWMLRTR